PLSLSTRSVAKIFNGAPKRIPIPKPAIQEEMANCHFTSIHVGNNTKPVADMKPDKKTATIGPLLSTSVPPRAAPTPDANAKGVSQYPEYSAATPSTCSVKAGI